MVLTLTTGDLWDDASNRPIDNGCHPESETPEHRRTLAYISQFRERIPLKARAAPAVPSSVF